MLKKIFSLVLASAGSTLAATVAQMSGTVFTSEQFAPHPQQGMPAPAIAAIVAGMVGLFVAINRKSRRA